MVGMAPDERMGRQALHPSPGGERWALFAYIRENTYPGARRIPLCTGYWIPITMNSVICMTNASQNAMASGVR